MAVQAPLLIERGDGYTNDLDMVLEIAGSMGIIPGTTICGLADGNNWAVKTIVNKFRDEFEPGQAFAAADRQLDEACSPDRHRRHDLTHRSPPPILTSTAPSGGGPFV